jgi:D-cysteine desulfhydrase
MGGVTPLTPLASLRDVVGGPRLLLKRDDQLGLCGGGNKTRKLEYLMADALRTGADTVVATGYAQSNFCRLLAAACATEGLRCVLLLEREHPADTEGTAGGNELLSYLLGAEVGALTGLGALTADFVDAELDRLRAGGARPYLMPRGGANPLGGLGYVDGAYELRRQLHHAGLRADLVVCPTGTGGTHAGLLAGFWAADGDDAPGILGVSVHDTDRRALRTLVHQRATEVLELLGGHPPLPAERVEITTDFVGPGYGIPTPEGAAAIRLFARLEGVLLDPVYTAKTAAGLLAMVQDGRLEPDATVVLLHTGGLPLLFAHSQALMTFPADAATGAHFARAADAGATRTSQEKEAVHARAGI